MLTPHRTMTLWELMQDFDGHAIVANATFLGSAGTTWRRSPPRFSPEAMAEVTARISQLVQGLSNVDAPISLKAARALLHCFQQSAPEPDGHHLFTDQKLGTTIGHIDKICNVMGDELGNIILVQLSAKHRELYDQQFGLFGKTVDDKFPDAVSDISEAGKCLALRRYTACVFHLMRAMEVAVKVLSGKLQIANLDRTWGKLLSDMHLKIEQLPKGDARNRWSEIHANLYHVKQAWRNDTMHPKATYTEEEASEVLAAVRAFMRNLADQSASGA